MNHIFISYSRKDTDIMEPVVAFLENKGFDLWTDGNLTPGTRAWKLAIEKAIEGSAALVAIMSPDAKASEWVDRELEYARIRDIPIFPLLAKGDPVNSVPFELINSQWIDIAQAEKYTSGLDRLVKVLDAHFGIERETTSELIHNELIRITQKMPDIYWIGITTSVGITLAYYEQMPTFNREESGNQIAAMIATLVGLGERTANRLNIGEMHYTIMGAAEGIVFMLPCADYYVFAGLRDVRSLEASVILLREWIQPLATLLQL